MDFKGTELVEKQNILNELRCNSMNLQELRFFSIYLSKINARDVNTRKVRFTIEDFQKIMELGRMNMNHMKRTTNSLLSKVVNIKNEKGGYTAFQLFKECEVSADENNVWYVQIDAHDKALPLMFDFKEKYFTYPLWNILRLTSSYHLRIYELMKQHQNQGSWKVQLVEFRELIGIAPQKYPRFGDFKTWILLPAQKALEEHTDVKFDFELIKANRKVIAIKFKIHTNTPASGAMSLTDFVDAKSVPGVVENNYELTSNERSTLIALAANAPYVLENYGVHATHEQIKDYVARQEEYVKAKSPANYFAYLKKAIAKNYASLPPLSQGSFDTDEFFAAALRNSYSNDIDIEELMKRK